MELNTLDEVRELLSLLSDEKLKTLDDSRKDEILNSILEACTELARDSFYVYVLLMAPLLIPEGFKDGRHIEVVCEALQSLFDSVDNPERKAERLQIFLPPRAMKSRIGSILFPSWVLGRKPNWNIICVGNSTKFAEDEFGRNVRDLIMSRAYRAIFPDTKLRKDAKSVGLFTTTKNGKYMATGAGTSIAGRGAHITICDDVLSEQTAISKAERTKINKWYISGLRSRLSPTPQGAEVIINTRWALDDLSGHVIKVDEGGKRPWKVISIPAILDEAGSKVLRRANDNGEKYMPGTSFWPEFQPLDELEERMREYHQEGRPDMWYALYMQNPIPPSGNIIKFEEWRPWVHKDPPNCVSVIISLDTAYSLETKADFSAYTVWGVFPVKEKDFRGNEFYRNHGILLQAGRGKWDFGTLCDKVIDLNGQFKPDVIIIEKKSSGQSLIQEMQLRGLPVWAFLTDRDKATRLNSVAPLFRTGSIWYPDPTDDPTLRRIYKEWTSIVIDEVCTFPGGAHDDLTDTVSQALIYLRENMSIVHPSDSVLQSKDEDDNQFNPRKTYWSSLLSSANG